jgi:ketohexokinase
MSTVLTNLNRKCELLTTFSNDKTFVFVIDDLKERGIDIKNCFYYPNSSLPFSTIILSRNTGCRTIVHSNKNLPHVNFDIFDKCDLNEYEWIHFEARTVLETTKMMEKIKKFNESRSDEQKIKISLELEKKRDENLLLIKYADVAVLGRDYAEILDCFDKKSAIRKLKKLTIEDERYKNEKITLICPWGSDGAAALDEDGNYYESPVFSPDKVVDTLGAGDTFCAGLIDSLLTNYNDVQKAIERGCKIAGYKCGYFGYDCVKNYEK